MADAAQAPNANSSSPEATNVPSTQAASLNFGTPSETDAIAGPKIFPTVVQIEGKWVELSCHLCGANATRRLSRFFMGIASFCNHIVMAHPEAKAKGRDAVQKRLHKRELSEGDVEKLRRGEELEHPILMKFCPEKERVSAEATATGRDDTDMSVRNDISVATAFGQRPNQQIGDGLASKKARRATAGAAVSRFSKRPRMDNENVEPGEELGKGYHAIK